jgi:hypothetical protein
VSMAEQTGPFGRCEETVLSESARSQVHVETWLWLPGAEASPLAHLGQGWPRPPGLLASRRPEELGVATMMRISRSESETGPENEGEQLENRN